MDDTSQPITGICLISKPKNVPTGYQCIQKTFDDTARDADLMPDSVFERKDRFICITRCYVLENNRTPIIEDIKLIYERDPIPVGYMPLAQTIDTNEKGTVRRVICVKRMERQAGMKCICDIVFLYRSRRPPPGYTLLGDINGLQMCVKEGTVPALRMPPSNISSDPSIYQRQTSADYSTYNTISKKTDEKDILDGIPFEINQKYLNNSPQPSDDSLSSLNILSINDIEKIFSYDFNLEQSVLNIRR